MDIFVGYVETQQKLYSCKGPTKRQLCYIPGDPRKCDELVFFNNFKSSKDRTKFLDVKEAKFYEKFSDINDLKIRALVTTQRLDQ